MIEACIFDLDGVLVDTAKYHYLSWQFVVGSIGHTLDDRLEENLKGINRSDSLEIVLDAIDYDADDNEKLRLATLKNDWYLNKIAEMKEVPLLPGVLDFLNQLKKKGIKLAVGSASRNAKPIIAQTQIHEYFSIIIDGQMVQRTKPDPEVFVSAAEFIGCPPSKCVVFDDSFKGIEAANRGGFYSVGIGHLRNLPNAQYVIAGFENVTPESVFGKVVG